MGRAATLIGALLLVLFAAYAAQQAGTIGAMRALNGVAFLLIMALARSVWRAWQQSRAQDRIEGLNRAITDWEEVRRELEEHPPEIPPLDEILKEEKDRPGDGKDDG